MSKILNFIVGFVVSFVALWVCGSFVQWEVTRPDQWEDLTRFTILVFSFIIGMIFMIDRNLYK